MKIFILFLSLLLVSCSQKQNTNTAKDDKSTTGNGTEKSETDKKAAEKKEIGKATCDLYYNI